MRTPFGIALLLILIFSEEVISQIAYTPDIALRNAVRKETWQQLKPKTPKNQQILMGLVFNSNEPFNSYEKAAKKRGWLPYELHTAASFFRIVCDEVARGKDYTEPEYKAIYAKTKAKYNAGRIDAKLTERKQQAKYDALIIKAFWVAGMFELAKKNSPEVQELARQLLRENLVPDADHTLAINQKTAIGESSNNKTGNSPKTTPAEDRSVNNSGNIQDIILRTVTSYGLNGMYVDNEVNVLYKNGEVFTNPTQPLESFDILKSKKTSPKKWDRWRKKGNVIYVTRSRNGKTYDWKKWFDLRPGSEGQKINGKFNSSDAFGGSTVINASTVYFDDQGRFAWKTVKGGNTAWKPIFSKSASAGTYFINKHSIVFKYNNGAKEAFFFGFYPKDYQHFIIGANHFVPVKK